MAHVGYTSELAVNKALDSAFDQISKSSREGHGLLPKTRCNLSSFHHHAAEVGEQPSDTKDMCFLA